VLLLQLPVCLLRVPQLVRDPEALRQRNIAIVCRTPPGRIHRLHLLLKLLRKQLQVRCIDRTCSSCICSFSLLVMLLLQLCLFLLLGPWLP
jgi:hypothetical protein